MAILRETLLAFVRVWFTYAGPLEREDDDDQTEALFDAFLDEVARGVGDEAAIIGDFGSA